MTYMKALTIMRIALPAVLALASTASYADNMRGFYVGGGISTIDVDKSASFKKADIEMAEVVAGYKYNAWLGAEVRYGTGLNSTPLDLQGAWGDISEEFQHEVRMEIDHYRAVYYRPEAVNQTGRFYGLIGYAEIDYNLSAQGYEAESSEDGLSWGLGLGFIITPRLNLNFEYKNLMDMDDLRFTTITGQVDYRF